ncbi:N-6 DNA methylase [Actinomadura syzygii]|uniref:N-6 DNA methylase n=1 Tax=Actinomadura syzygii TaxID=1427538 RepID=UPI001CA3316A|nr:N-6 DNA methylase [Actinomadura syzygii]
MRLLKANAGAKRMTEVFDDFVEMAALAFRNVVDPVEHDRREEQYLRTAGHYDRAALDRFARALALVTLVMQTQPCDVLGRLYMELDLGNEHLGQFFTPYDVARLVASMRAEPVIEQARDHGFAELYEPTCGPGAFIVAVSQAMREHGLNPQTQLHVTAEDVSPQAVHMVYVHLALLHIPAVVHRRDTLTLQRFDTWPTPAHVLGGWSQRLRWARAVDGSRALIGRTPPPAGPPSSGDTGSQLLTRAR